jgi:hypothetical protein
VNILPSGTVRRCARAAILACLPAIALLAAGCGGSGSPSVPGAPASTPKSGSTDGQPATQQPAAAASTPTSPSLGNTTVDACKLLTPAEIASVLGEKVAPLADSLPGQDYSCATDTGSDSGTYIIVSVTVHGNADSQALNLDRPANAQNVSGLGSDAFCSPTDFLLEVLDGTNLLDIGSNSCAHSEALARIALPKL